MNVRQRLHRLEQALSQRSDDRCPRCPRVAVVYYRRDSLEGEPVLKEGEHLPAPCAACGRPADVLVVVEDKHFFQRPN